MAKSQSKTAADASVEHKSRRDFIVVATYAMGAVGAGAFVWPLVDQMNPAADTLALASIEVDVSKIAEIEEASVVSQDDLRDPEGDEVRAQKPEYLVVLGVCTHLGCVPLGQKVGEVRGEYGGWFCPCHGSHYDSSGRIRKGPAPLNIEVPPYSFLSDQVIRIG